MTRGSVALVALSVLVGFAPAPFPRERRDDRTILSLAACQGTWEVVSIELYTANGMTASNWVVTHIRIRDDRWTLLSKDGLEVGSYALEIGTGRVATIDWYAINGKNLLPLWGGLVQRKGDLVLIMYSDGDRRGTKRQRDIESAPVGSYLITVRRGR